MCSRIRTRTASLPRNARPLLPHLVLTVGLAVLLAAPLVVLVPPGEAPDEPSHFLYLDHLLRHGSLPRIAGEAPFQGPAYEAFQPPLAYLAMAGVLVLAGVERIDFPCRPDPDFAFQRNRRALLPAPASERTDAARRAVHLARAANLFWLAIASGAILVTCLRVSTSPWAAFGAGVPFALSPQLLFVSATVGNDAAVTALTAAATACLMMLAASPDCRKALGASTFAGLALWAKASAAITAPAIAILMTWQVLHRRWRILLSLALPGLVLSAGWAALEHFRTGILPGLPAGWNLGVGIIPVLTRPRWILSAWGSFWAKLGWFNVVLPWPAYLAFVPPTLAVLLGLTFAVRSRSKAGGLLAVIAAANLLLLVLFLVRVDWQPQGRYLLPSAAAIAGLAALGFDRVCLELRRETVRALALASFALSVAVAAVADLVVAMVY